jgi:hypothetical protein
VAVTLEEAALPGAVTSTIAVAPPPATPDSVATLPPPSPIAVLTPVAPPTPVTVVDAVVEPGAPPTEAFSFEPPLPPRAKVVALTLPAAVSLTSKTEDADPPSAAVPTPEGLKTASPPAPPKAL